jgi:SMC interacting uncharacterized protein involved in chromosome segregation
LEDLVFLVVFVKASRSEISYFRKEIGTIKVDLSNQIETTSEQLEGKLDALNGKLESLHGEIGLIQDNLEVFKRETEALQVTVFNQNLKTNKIDSDIRELRLLLDQHNMY